MICCVLIAAGHQHNQLPAEQQPLLPTRLDPETAGWAGFVADAGLRAKHDEFDTPQRGKRQLPLQHHSNVTAAMVAADAEVKDLKLHGNRRQLLYSEPQVSN